MRTNQTLPLFAVVTAAFSLFLLTGCSSKMTKKECESKVPYSVGQRDGEDGKSIDNFNRMSAECSAEGVNMDAEQYKAGRTVGLSHYCSESRAKSDAKSGKTDSICLTEHFPPYVSAYQAKLGELKDESNKALDHQKSKSEKAAEKQHELQNQVDKLNAQDGATQNPPGNH